MEGACRAVTGPTCQDTRLNGDETDVDCGGWACPACGLAQTCRNDHDCRLGFICHTTWTRRRRQRRTRVSAWTTLACRVLRAQPVGPPPAGENAPACRVFGRCRVSTWSWPLCWRQRVLTGSTTHWSRATTSMSARKDVIMSEHGRFLPLLVCPPSYRTMHFCTHFSHH